MYINLSTYLSIYKYINLYIIAGKKSATGCECQGPKTTKKVKKTDAKMQKLGQNQGKNEEKIAPKFRLPSLFPGML